jgi:hypothetical protein
LPCVIFYLASTDRARPDLNFIQIECNRRAVLRQFIALLRTPCLNEKLDAVTTILCRGNAYKEIPDIISANLDLINAGLFPAV